MTSILKPNSAPIILALMLGGAIFFAAIPSAEAAIVPEACRGEKIRDNPQSCTLCHIGVMVNNFTDFLMTNIAFPAAVLLIASGGIVLMISGPSEERRTLGKNILQNAIIGLVIVMLAWLIVDTLIKILTGSLDIGGEPGSLFKRLQGIPSKFGPWNKIDPTNCELSGGVATGITLVSGTGTGLGGGGSSQLSSGPSSDISFSPTRPTQPSGAISQSPLFPTGPTVLCPSQCSPITVPIKATACAGAASGFICRIHHDTENKMEVLNGKLKAQGIAWEVTEAWPPTIQHQNPCHANGTCVDAALRGFFAPQHVPTISAFIAAAQTSDLRAVYEVREETRRVELIQLGVPAENIQVVRGINAEHFSVYNDKTPTSRTR